MKDEHVARAILTFIKVRPRTNATYLEIRTALTASLGISNELVIWNELQELINVDRALDNGGIIPGDRDRLCVTMTPAGLAILNRARIGIFAFDPPGGQPADESGETDVTRPKILEW